MDSIKYVDARERPCYSQNMGNQKSLITKADLCKKLVMPSRKKPIGLSGLNRIIYDLGIKTIRPNGGPGAKAYIGSEDAARIEAWFKDRHKERKAHNKP